MNSAVLFGLTGISGVCWVAFRRWMRRYSVVLPPSPPGDPIIGHARFIPLSHTWIKFSKWCKIYGEIFYVHVLGRPIVVVSSFTAARELMEKRGKNYSDRPHLVMHPELMGWKKTMVFLSHNDELRRQRRFVQAILTPQSITMYHPLITTHVHTLLDNLAKTPEAFRDHIHYCIACIVIRFTYGYDFESPMDPRKLIADKVNSVAIEGGAAGANIVDLLPIMRYVPSWFPGAKFKRVAIDGNLTRQAMFDDLYNFAWKNKKAGTEKPSLMAQMFQKFGEEVETDNELKETFKAVGGVMYAAGVDTTDVTISTFVLLMTIYPEFAKRAQKQIDEVTSRKRLPTWEDRRRLPYVDCILKEVWRWHPPVPMGVPHQSREEDTYNGVTIPAKSVIMPNMWHMLRDEEYYSDPYTFNPERFMPLVRANEDAGSESNTNGGDPKYIVFGFGRRACPGLHIADATIWLALACILARFDILRPLDPTTGEEFIPEEKYLSNFTSPPDVFRSRIVPRKLESY